LSEALAVPVVSASNDLLIVGENGLTTQRIDVRRARLEGAERTIATDVAQAFSFDAAPVISVSRNGTLVYRVGAEERKILVWVDRTGRRLETVTGSGNYRAPAISPDQSKIAVGRDGDIWIIDRARANAETRLTGDSTVEVSPVWSPDGRQVAFSSFRGSWRLYAKSASGAGPEIQLTDAGEAFAEPFDWSRDGRYLSYFTGGGVTGAAISILSMTGTPKAEQLIASRFNNVEPRFSPDSRWLVYVSNESGRYEIYVQSLPLSDIKVQISTNGGMQPIWSGDGREIFYLGLDGRLMAATVTTSPQFTAGIPHALFQSNANVMYTHNSYAPSADGQRFIVATYGGTEAPALAVVLNWAHLLRPVAGR
jgi:Tol biopolymer transport system component